MGASYLNLSDKDWDKKLATLANLSKPCVLCPHRCAVDRKEKLGVCKAPQVLRISSSNLHFGEEPPVSGERGSGTIFLTHCNLHCTFCQNYPISQMGHGEDISVEEFSKLMLKLQERKAHNINFVSPMHYTSQIVHAVKLAVDEGLRIPIVWNSNGYENVETIRALEGIVDIYMPDIKYSCDDTASRLSKAPGYFETAVAAVKEMQRQVGRLRLDKDGMATRGLLIRHLVLPNDLSGTREVLKAIAERIDRSAFISLMSQYFPAHKANSTEDLSRRIRPAEYRQALKWLEEFELDYGFIQDDILEYD